MLDYFFGLFSHDIAVDLGTANTLVLVKGKGIVIREPSAVAQHKKTKQVLAIGSEAKKMVGRTPSTIVAVRPLRHGVISDFDATEAMLKYFIRKVHEKPSSRLPKIPRPRVVIGIPSGVTEVERRAVADAATSAGARQVFLIEEPMAAAIGAELPIAEASGTFIVDIGGGTTEIAVISLGGIVVNRSIRIAGDEMDEDIIGYLRLRYGVLIGERTAEDIKLTIGSATEIGGDKEMVVRGRDLETGLPKTLKISSAEIREAISPTVRQIISAIAETIEETPPEMVADLVDGGITITGGGALMPGMAKLIAAETKLPVFVADDPLTTVVRGCGKLLTDEATLNAVKITAGLS